MPATAVIAFTTDHTAEDWTDCAQSHTQTDRRTKVKTVHLPLSLRSLSGYNKS